MILFKKHLKFIEQYVNTDLAEGMHGLLVKVAKVPFLEIGLRHEQFQPRYYIL